MSGSWVAALPTLLAVIVGAVIGALANIGIAYWQERADARAAARMVDSELREVLETLVMALQGSRFDYPAFGRSEQWRTHRLALARRFSTDEWRALEDAYMNTDLILRVSAEDTKLRGRIALTAKHDVREALRVVHAYVEPRRSRSATPGDDVEAGVKRILEWEPDSTSSSSS